MEEQVEDVSEISLSDEEFDPNQFEDNGDEWEIGSDESASQVSKASESTVLSDECSSVCVYFEKDPNYAPGFNVCSKCSKRYKSSTSVSNLRKHLETHQIKVLTKKEKTTKKKENRFSKQEQEEHDKYLIQWIIQDLQPFTVVDNPFFRAFIDFLCSRYTIPDRHKVKGKIDI
jgi:hypothetical protein